MESAELSRGNFEVIGGRRGTSWLDPVNYRKNHIDAHDLISVLKDQYLQF